MTYFNGYVHGKSIKILSQHYHKIIRKIEEHEGNIFDGWWLHAR